MPHKGKADKPAGIPETRVLLRLKGRLCVQIVIRTAMFEDLASLEDAFYSGGIDAKLLAQLFASQAKVEGGQGLADLLRRGVRNLKDVSVGSGCADG